MPFDDDATMPMQPLRPAAPPAPPTWPALSPQPARTQRGHAAPQRPVSFWRGCGLAVALAGVFVAGMVVATILMALVFLPPPVPAASASSPNALVKVTITDAFLNEALASSTPSTLTRPQSHISSGGMITISGTLQGVPIESGKTAVIVVEPSVTQGKLTINAVSGSVDGLRLPGYALTSITTSVNSQLVQMSDMPLGNGQQLTIRGVSFANGAMTVSYA